MLTDFGLCKEGIEGLGTTSTFCGTPEVCLSQMFNKPDQDSYRYYM